MKSKYNLQKFGVGQILCVCVFLSHMLTKATIDQEFCKNSYTVNYYFNFK